MKSKGKLILFADCDGTLLDHDTYSYEDAIEGINLLSRNGIPLVMVSSKTETEMEELHGALSLDAPFVFENGGGIVYPTVNGHIVEFISRKSTDSMRVGLSILEAEFHVKLTALTDMSPDEVASATGLSPGRAVMAMARQTSLPFLAGPVDIDISAANHLLEHEDLQLTKGGRFYHLLSSEVSKGAAVGTLKEYYENIFSSRCATAGIGDGYNDLPMLRAVDIPFLVRKKDGNFIACDINDIRMIDGAGPAGFTMAVKRIIQEREQEAS